MPNLPDQAEIAKAFAESWSIIVGCVIVVTYAKRRFNEPSGSNSKALPQAVEPLRYLFLKPQYRRARSAYLVASVALYLLLLLPGPIVVSMLSIDEKILPPQAWALLIALVLVGLVPNSSNFKWVLVIEEELRRIVHEHYFVPKGVEETIALLQDVSYDPPAAQVDKLSPTVRTKILEGLKAPTSSVAHRWARARMLIESLTQMGAGDNHPLRKSNFEPFLKDFEVIQEKYEALTNKIGQYGAVAPETETDRKIMNSVESLLDKIYAYISWGVRQQANTDREVNETFLALGFDIPPENDISLFNVVFPAALSAAAVAFLFSWLVDATMAAIGDVNLDVARSVITALSAAMAACIMYWGAVHFALGGRKDQIRRKVWSEGSPICLVPIAIKAGLMTWAVIVAVTMIWHPAETWRSLTLSWEASKSLVTGAGGLPFETWNYLFLKVSSAMPWFTAGAMVSVVIAYRLGGDVRRSDGASQLWDALWLACGLGVAAGMADLFQTSTVEYLKSLGIATEADRLAPLRAPAQILGFALLSALAGFVCGGIIGLKVPAAYKSELRNPKGKVGSKALRDLLSIAEVAKGSRAAAEDWVFGPHEDMNGLTPAEGVRYRELTTGVRGLLAKPARSDRPTPLVIEGGLAS
jgi:hypothetical protein